MNKEKLNISQKEDILAARKASLERINNSEKYDYLNDTVAFHWKKLYLTEPLTVAIRQFNPTIFLLNEPENVSFDNKIWGLNDVKNILSFDDIEKIEENINDEDFEKWIKADIIDGLGMIKNQLTSEKVVICYSEGKSDFSKQWLEIFKSFLSK